MPDLKVRDAVAAEYGDLLTPEVLNTLHALAPFDVTRQQVMRERLERRAARARD
jgi:hypothetical protein